MHDGSIYLSIHLSLSVSMYSSQAQPFFSLSTTWLVSDLAQGGLASVCSRPSRSFFYALCMFSPSNSQERTKQLKKKNQKKKKKKSNTTTRYLLPPSSNLLPPPPSPPVTLTLTPSSPTTILEPTLCASCVHESPPPTETLPT